MESDHARLGGDAASLLDLCAFVAAIVAAVGHNDDLLEEGNRGTAHLDESVVEALRTGRWELHHFFLNVTLLRNVALVIDGLAKVDCVRCDFRIGSLSLRESLLLRLHCQGLHFL